MPTIQLYSKNKSEPKQRNETDNRKLRQKAYNTVSWRKLRNTFIREHAVCADCIGKGRITPSEDVHHIVSPFKNGQVNYSLLLDPTNLVSLCKECHQKRHQELQGYKTAETIIKELDALFETIEDDNE